MRINENGIIVPDELIVEIGVVKLKTVEDLSYRDIMAIYCTVDHNDEDFIWFVQKFGITDDFDESVALLERIKAMHLARKGF